jgi:hypothetical protein
MNAAELENRLCKMLDAIAAGAKLSAASRDAGMASKYIFEAINRSKADDPLTSVRWRGENFRQFAELIPHAMNAGRVKRDQDLRAVTINGEAQYVIDPALQMRFGFDDDAKDLAELSGYPDFPFAHDVDGNRIPLLSARHPRPQRKHRNSPPLVAVSEQSSGADMQGRQFAAGKPQREWRPDDPLPPWHRDVHTAAEPPRVFISTPATPRVRADSPLRAELMERLQHLKEHGPANPRAVDRHGRLTMPQMFRGQKADDPPEKIGA